MGQAAPLVISLRGNRGRRGCEPRDNELGDAVTHVLMLLDNHYAPDRRVEAEANVLLDAGVEVSIIAWDRRFNADDHHAGAADRPQVRRVAVPCRPSGGLHSFRRLLAFYRRVIRDYRRLVAAADVLVCHDVYLMPFGSSPLALLQSAARVRRP